MESERKSQNHTGISIANFLGLRTSQEDTRALPPGYQGIAHNLIYDAEGNARPRDGYAQWWAALGQRSYLAEMEPAENSEWTNGAATVTKVKYGSQARVMAHGGVGTIAPVRAIGTTQDLTCRLGQGQDT